MTTIKFNFSNIQCKKFSSAIPYFNYLVVVPKVYNFTIINQKKKKH